MQCPAPIRTALGKRASIECQSRQPIEIPYVLPYTLGMRKTSVYLDEQQAERLAYLALKEGRSQAEILREAVAAYRPKQSRDREFALSVGFERRDKDPRPLSEISEHELLEGFGS